MLLLIPDNSRGVILMAEKTAAKASGKEEQVGFHKGSLATLAKERQELGRMIGIVEQLMQMHIKALKELGVDLVKQAEGMQKDAKKDKSKPIEDLV